MRFTPESYELKPPIVVKGQLHTNNVVRLYIMWRVEASRTKYVVLLAHRIIRLSSHSVRKITQYSRPITTTMFGTWLMGRFTSTYTISQ